MSTHAVMSVENGVAHIALQAGPSARLTLDVLKQIETALEIHAQSDTADILVLSSKGAFPSGLTDPVAGGDDTKGLLADLCHRLDGYPKPVIAVLSGAVVGGGAELALACHYRLAQTNVRIGFPHARLGLLPNAGATQRLPRLVGAKAAIDLLVGGNLCPIEGHDIAVLADQTFEKDPYQAVLAFVADLRKAGLSPRPSSEVQTGFAEPLTYHANLVEARKTLTKTPNTAPSQILSCIEAAQFLPFEAGLAFEQAAYEDCRATPASAALTHLFHAEQTANAHTRRRDLPQLNAVGVLGGGPFAAKIVLSALDAGLRVNWIVQDPSRAREGVDRVKALLKKAVETGQISAVKARQCQDALHSGTDSALLGDVDLALRAARGQRNMLTPPGLPVAHCLPGADARLSMRFGPSTAQPPMVEIVLGPEGDEPELLAALAYAKRLNLLAVVEHAAGVTVSDRMTHALWRACDALIDLGQSPYVIDDAMRGWGMIPPPFSLADRSGLGLVARHERDPSSSNWAGVLIQHGRTGLGQSGGFYSYAQGDVPQRDDKVTALLNTLRPAETDLPVAQIRRLILGALANEAARLVQEGTARRAQDIDLVTVLTGLVPRWRGGVLHSTETEGLLQVTRTLNEFTHPDKGFWALDPIFADLIKNGLGFGNLPKSAD